jgi:vancomycin resistance protein YoaR
MPPLQTGDRWFLAGAGALLLGVAGWCFVPRPRDTLLAGYATSLKGRTPNQVHNAVLAARTIDGTWLRPGQVFSFNRTVGSWSSASGYRRAPVSYDGELMPSWGGGVCQASTTLYNAAIAAGLTPLERHRHQWKTDYVPPGRDAAVAYSNIDLRFRNDYPWPVRIESDTRGTSLAFRIMGPRRPLGRWEIRQEPVSRTEPGVVRTRWEPGMPRRVVRNPGKPGYRVRTYRVRIENGRETRRELLSDDIYPAMNRLELVR